MRSTPSLCPLHLTKSSHPSFVWWWLTNIVKQLCLSFATSKMVICHFDWDNAFLSWYVILIGMTLFSRRTAVWVFSEIQRKTTSLWALLLAQLKEELQSSSFNHKTRKSKSIPVCLTFYNQNGTLWLKQLFFFTCRKDNFTFKCHRSNGTGNANYQDIYAVSL